MLTESAPCYHSIHPPPLPLVLIHACPNMATLRLCSFGPVLDPQFLRFQFAENVFIDLCKLQEGTDWVSKCGCKYSRTRMLFLLSGSLSGTPYTSPHHTPWVVFSLVSAHA